MNKVVPLASTVDFIRGITFKPDDLIDPNDDDAVVCMRTKNIQSDLDTSDLIAVPSRFVRREELFLRPSDMLISSANSWNLVGKTVCVGELNYPATAGGFISIVRPRSNVIDARYLYRWITYPQIQNAIRNCGRQTTNISNLSVERFLDLGIPLPKLDEQRRVAAILYKADAIRRRRQALLKDSDELIRSAFLQLLEGLPDERVSIEELLPATPNAIRTGPFGSQLLHSEFTETGIPVLGIDNVVTNRFRWAERRYVSAQKYQELRRYRVFPGDVMVTIMGTTGRVCIAPHDLPECISTKHLCTISPDRERLLPEFLWASLLWDPVVRAQAAREGKGAIMEGWNMGIVRGLLIKLATIGQQQDFAAFVRKAELLRIKYVTAELQANELFSSLAHRAFNGQLQGQ